MLDAESKIKTHPNKFWAGNVKLPFRNVCMYNDESLDNRSDIPNVFAGMFSKAYAASSNGCIINLPSTHLIIGSLNFTNAEVLAALKKLNLR